MVASVGTPASEADTVLSNYVLGAPGGSVGERPKNGVCLSPCHPFLPQVVSESPL